MKMRNGWNRFVYRLWSPVYDLVFERLFRAVRRRAMQVLDLRPGDRVCLLGVGTGSDLGLLPEGVEAVGVDLSEPMLARAKAKLPIPGRRIELRVADAQQCGLQGSAFDAVVLNLILSVVPDASRCLAEALRVLRPGGRIVVFDKFLADNARPSWKRRLGNLLSTFLGTNINRRLSDITAGRACEVTHDEAGLLGGMYRVVLLAKSVPADTAQPVERAG